MKPGNYYLLRIRLILRAILSGKITLRRIWNASQCYLYYVCGKSRSGRSPIVLNVELWNECNEACLFCRTKDGEIYHGESDGPRVSKGKADINKLVPVIREISRDLLVLVPYINGEPLISKDLPQILQICKENKLITLIASNGISLDLNKSMMLLESNVDFVKVHISGMTNEVHQIQHRTGDINKILKNIEIFQSLNKKRGDKTLVVLDYIYYNHNKHELELAKDFCVKNRVLLNIRPGNNKFLENSEAPNSEVPVIPLRPCDWAWGTAAIDWNGDVQPCCDHVLWPTLNVSGNISSTSFSEIWNGKELADFRNDMVKNGRNTQPCKNCTKQGIKFKV